MEKYRCWHFIQDDYKLRWGRRPKVKAGKTYHYCGTPKLCKMGMHGSECLIDALYYAPGPILCEVEIWGNVIRDTNKLVGQHRKVLRMIDATKILHRAACWFAEQALKSAGVTDKRCWNAIKTKRRWLKGLATDEELLGAQLAAQSATWTAGAAAGMAAWSAAAAAWSAAESAVKLIWVIARTAAWSTERSERNRYLTRMVRLALAAQKPPPN